MDWTQDQISEVDRQSINQNFYGLELATIESTTNGNSVEQKHMLKDMAYPDVPFNPKQFTVRTFVSHSSQTLYGFSTTQVLLFVLEAMCYTCKVTPRQQHQRLSSTSLDPGKMEE